MNFFVALLSTSFISFALTYCPHYFFKKNGQKTHFYSSIKLSIDEIPLKNKEFIVVKRYKENFNLKFKPNVINHKPNTLSDSEKNNILIEEKTNEFFFKEKIDTNEHKNVKHDFTVMQFVNQKESINEIDNTNNEEKTSIKITDTINKSFLYSPKIKAQKALYDSSKENISEVQSNYFPSIDFNASKGFTKDDTKSSISTSNEDRYPQDISITLEQDLYSGGKITAEIKKAKNQYLIEQENLKLVEQEVILESAKVFLELLEQKKLIEINQIKEFRYTKDLNSIEFLDKVGKASKSDLIFAKSQLTKIVADKIASINHLEVIETKYKNTVGDIVLDSLLIEPNFQKLNLPDNYNKAETLALNKNPKYRKILIEEKISKNEVKSQFADALPKITLDAEYRSADDFTSRGSTSNTAEITAELKVPIFRGGKNLSKIKQAKLIAKKVRYDLENKKYETIEEVKSSWSEYKTSEVNLRSAKINYEAKKLILEGIEQEAKLGMRSYIDVLVSKENLIDAEFEKIKAHNQLMFSALQLKANIGELSLKNLDI